ncbi:MAG: hypothetical protein EPN97_02445 [Alphaproteobacteria bacterium]|nr:MAG: hypothetical protein EPN97_02445 [Alphaproteobacteria bacterium]
MFSDDEQKVVDNARDAMGKRADFFNEAAKRHPKHAKEFSALAEATRDMAQLSYAEKPDSALSRRVADQYGPNLKTLLIASARDSSLMDELKNSQEVVMREMDDFYAANPSLVPVRDALQKKLNGPK